MQEARKEAEQCGNIFAKYVAGGGIANLHFTQGRMEDAYNTLRETLLAGIGAGLIRLYAAPWVLEIVSEFHRTGFEPIPEFEFPQMIDRIQKGVNIHLRGVALRILARDKILRGCERRSIEADLKESETNLRRSGDPVQLSKAFQERARLELSLGNREQARRLILTARRLLGGYVDEFFPDEFQNFLRNQKDPSDSDRIEDGFLERFLDMIESLYPSESQNEILRKMLTATSRMFAAERSGFFWFPERTSLYARMRTLRMP